MTDRLKGKIAIISGGATGMGGAASRLFAAEGARVAIIDRNGDAAAATVREIRDAGGVADHWVADVSNEAAVNAAVKSIEDRFGAVTVLFNHAGTIVIKPFLETTLEEWEWWRRLNRSQTSGVLVSRISEVSRQCDFTPGGDGDGAELAVVCGREMFPMKLKEVGDLAMDRDETLALSR